MKTDAFSINLNDIEQNRVPVQTLTHTEWKVVRDRAQLLNLRVAAHLLDSYIQAERAIK